MFAAPPSCTRKPSGSSLSPSDLSTRPLAASSRISRATRGGSAKIERTANINSVPMPFSRVSGNTCLRAPWCIMWKPTMNTSQTSSRIARSSISLVKSTIGFSVRPMCLILPLSFSFEQRRRDARRARGRIPSPHAMQIEHVDIVGAHEAQRIVEARDHARGRHALAVARDRRLGRDHDLVARERLQRLAHHAFGAVARRGVDEIDAEVDRLVDQSRGLVLGLAGLQAEPAEAAGAEPGDADARPVRPRVV